MAPSCRPARPAETYTTVAAVELMKQQRLLTMLVRRSRFFIAIYVLAYLLSLSLQCRVHGETYSMFCTSKKSLMCVKCFRELPLDSRMHCVDLETAYNHGAKKLDKALTVSVSKLTYTLVVVVVIHCSDLNVACVLLLYAIKNSVVLSAAIFFHTSTARGQTFRGIYIYKEVHDEIVPWKKSLVSQQLTG